MPGTGSPQTRSLMCRMIARDAHQLIREGLSLVVTLFQ
jgi:hypothetical protein